jgi:MFS transporter, DHA1 family, tetracycline resistance protein
MFAIWLILFVIFLDWLGIGLVYPMFSSMLFSEKLLLPPETSEVVRGWFLGILLAVMPTAQFFSGPILGTISDQIGRKPILIATLLLIIFGYALSSLAIYWDQIWILILGRICIGIGAGNTAVVGAAVVDLSGDKKAKYFAYSGMVSGIGFTLGPYLGGHLSEISYIFPFIVAGLAVFINFLLILLFFEETLLVKKKMNFYLHEGFNNIKRGFQIKGLKALFIAIMFYCFGWSFFYEFIPIAWIYDYDLTSRQIGLFYAYGAGFYALSSGILIQPIIKWCNHYTIFFYGLIVFGTLILILLVNPQINWVWVYLPLCNFLGALLFPTSMSLVSNQASNEIQGEILGILQSVQSIAFATSPLVAGVLLGLFPHMPMLLGGVSMLIAALVLGLCLRKNVFFIRLP